MELADAASRIAPNVMAYIEVDMFSGCWLYRGTLTSDGYGQASVEGKTRRVHRYTYEKVKGPIPARHVLDHLLSGREVAPGPCTSRACCNPDHVEPVTQTENIRRVTPWNRTKVACPSGHDYAEHGDLRLCADGYTRRFCRECARIRYLKNRKAPSAA